LGNLLIMHAAVCGLASSCGQMQKLYSQSFAVQLLRDVNKKELSIRPQTFWQRNSVGFPCAPHNPAIIRFPDAVLSLGRVGTGWTDESKMEPGRS
jgi:hypothetical protein